MRREILTVKRGRDVSGCCPGHDDFPHETYRSRRSKRARARDKKIEHQYARSLLKRGVRSACFVSDVIDE
jgi:hypothetical protein